MKVILIKDCKDGKKNDVVDTSDGYATNFLIKQGFAVAMNSKSVGKMNREIEVSKETEDKKLANATKAKTVIESTTLSFSLKETNNKVFGSVTRKQIIKQLLSKGIHVQALNVENVKIESIGTTKINIKLYKTITAVLKVKVDKDE